MCNTAIRGPVQDRATSTRTLGEGPGVLGSTTTPLHGHKA